jgi:hypothetical protein
MYSKKQFTALEAMCRERAALARSEMEYSLMKYWLAEAEEWKQLGQSDPFKEELRTVPQALSEQQKTTNANGTRRKAIAGASRLCET